MDSLRKEIEAELKRTRLDKVRLYELLLKIIDNTGSKGPQGPQGPRGPQGPACVCKCVSATPSPPEETSVKKVVKKKVNL
jgi:hypothetical protein